MRPLPAARLDFAATTASPCRAAITPRFPLSAALDAALLIIGLAPGLHGANRHRPAVYRRLGRRHALPGPDPLRFRRRRLWRARRRWFAIYAIAGSPTRCAACRRRTSRRRHGDRRLPRFSRRGNRRHAATCAPCSASAASPMTARSKRSGEKAKPCPFGHGAEHAGGNARPDALRQLSLLALQHQYRRADAGHVRLRLREDRRRAWRGLIGPSPAPQPSA